MARPREFETQHVVRKALSVFWEKGYAATSLNDLEVATGVARMRLQSERFHWRAPMLEMMWMPSHSGLEHPTSL